MQRFYDNNLLQSSMNLNVELYKKLYLIRASEEAIIKYYHEDDMKTPMHMSMGEEAIVTGVCHALTDEDQVLGTYRSHALFLAKTQKVNIFFAEMYGKSTGTANGKSGSMHLSYPEKGMLVSSAIVASSIPTAVGVALANKMKKNNTITVVFFGDGAVDTGVFWESLNYACLENLPIIFVLENNGLAVHTSRKKRHGYDSISQLVSQYHCDTYEESSTDVESIYQITKKVIEKIRLQQRPALMNLSYYRYLEHVGINKDFHEGYRSEEEFEKWYKMDPVHTQRVRLLESNSIFEDNLIQIENEIISRIEASVFEAKKAPFSSTKVLYQDVYK